ncbi:uncharacterized protein RSE6_07473 [Rhynchosporium secalis]|uniref:Uncharacterized protein n=1 Tax=Rhynchosporium secalis TaxID=38038 RepID=A0A1E1MD22_RHYSE|nr:uncharacterized protein RSE6_07473 [Rhynchosporium secalis]
MIRPFDGSIPVAEIGEASGHQTLSLCTYPILVRLSWHKLANSTSVCSFFQAALRLEVHNIPGEHEEERS